MLFFFFFSRSTVLNLFIAKCSMLNFDLCFFISFSTSQNYPDISPSKWNVNLHCKRYKVILSLTLFSVDNFAFFVLFFFFCTWPWHSTAYLNRFFYHLAFDEHKHVCTVNTAHSMRVLLRSKSLNCLWFIWSHFDLNKTNGTIWRARFH